MKSAIIDFTFNNFWIISFFLVLFSSCLADYAQRKFFEKHKVTIDEVENPWYFALMRSAQKPLSLIIWLSAISFIISGVDSYLPGNSADHIDLVINIGFIGLGSYFFSRFIFNFEKSIVRSKFRKGEVVDHTTYETVSKLARLTIYIISSILVMEKLGFSLSAVMAFGGIGGIAIGFAAKDMLANVLAGLMLYIDRPFAVGDWIRSPDREIEGTVEEIGWRHCTIRTFSKRVLYVPNSIFGTVSLENPSRMTNRRIYEYVGLRYEDATRVKSIIPQIKEMIENHEDIDANQTIIVNLDRFSDSSIDFFVYCFTKTVNWQEFHMVKQKVLLEVIDIVEKNGAACAFPTHTIHIEPRSA